MSPSGIRATEQGRRLMKTEGQIRALTVYVLFVCLVTPGIKHNLIY